MIADRIQASDAMPAQGFPDVRGLIYMDHNGSTPTHPKAVAAMLPFLACAYGNPSGGHWAADRARYAIEHARTQVATLIGAHKDEIVFTSGATEANNLAIKGALPKPTGAHVITSAIEHDSVLKTVRSLRGHGARTSILPVDEFGVVITNALKDAISEQTQLISVMAANNETGTIQPVAEIASIARENGIPVHCDAAQAIGKMPVKVDELGVDFLSIAGHKFGAPNGIGALYVRKGSRLTPQIHGGGHEKGRRAGTESALLCAGLGAAAEAALTKDCSFPRGLRDYFWQSLSDRFGNRVVLNGHLENRVPNTLNISFPGYVGTDILATMPHVAATTGSACHTGCIDMSRVLLAMGKSTEIGLGTIRFSLGDGNTKDDVDEVMSLLVHAVD